MSIRFIKVVEGQTNYFYTYMTNLFITRMQLFTLNDSSIKSALEFFETFCSPVTLLYSLMQNKYLRCICSIKVYSQSQEETTQSPVTCKNNLVTNVYLCTEKASQFRISPNLLHIYKDYLKFY